MPDTMPRKPMRREPLERVCRPGRPGIRVLSGLALLLVLAASVSLGALQGGSQLRWYDAYDRGVAAVRAGNWQLAEQLLLQARKDGPPQSARALFYADNYRPFVPDYYLGIVYLRTNRPEDADKAFGTATAVAPRDREFAELPTLRAEAVKLASAKSAPPATTAPSNTRGAGSAAATTAAAAPASSAPATQQPVTQQPVTQQPITQTAQQTQPQAAPASAAPPSAAPPSAALPSAPAPLPTQTQAAVRPPSKAPPIVPGKAPNAAGIGTGGTSPYNPTQAGMAPKDVFARWRQGLRAFLVGDYAEAVTTLEQVVAQPGAPPDARLYLACARVAIVLTGRGDAAALAIARQEFQASGVAEALDDEDRRYISPRILAQMQAR